MPVRSRGVFRLTKWFCVTAESVAALTRLGAPALGSLWARRGFVAVFSCNGTSVWKTPGQGKTTHENFPGDLTGQDDLLDRTIREICAEKPRGGRLLVAPEGVYVDVEGARELAVGFLYLEEALSAAMQPRVKA